MADGGREGAAAAARLGAVPPFDALGPADLAALAASARPRPFGPGDPVIPFGRRSSAAVLLAGRARVCFRPGGGDEVVLGERGPGSAAGLFPAAAGGARFGLVGVSRGEALLIEGEALEDAARRHPALAGSLLVELVAALVDCQAAGGRGACRAGGAERHLWTTGVGELCGPSPVTAPPDATVREAAGRMARRRASSLVVVGAGGAPEGIVTDRDLREKVVAAGGVATLPVAAVMSGSLHAVDAGVAGIDALLEMMRHGVHHLPVTEGGRLRGVVTGHDLLLLQGASPLALVREIEAAADVAAVAAAAARTPPLIARMLEQGVRAAGVTRLVTELNDRLVRRVLALAEDAAGPAPLPWCWIAFGSEGRREQTLRTDQDNALVLADAATPGEEASAAAWAERFATFAGEALVRAGFPPCPGGYMASNPQWRRPLRAWRAAFAGWIETPTPEALLASVILFDFRPLAGQLRLGEELRALVTREAPRHPIFLKHLADLAAGVRPPVGLFGRLRAERDGEHRGTIDLKRRCLAPLINVVRLFAMEEGVAEPGTLERIGALRARHPVVRERGDELAQAFEFVSLLRLRAQLARLEAGRPPDNRVDPRRLPVPQRRALRDAARLILHLQEGIRRRYSPGTRL